MSRYVISHSESRDFSLTNSLVLFVEKLQFGAVQRSDTVAATVLETKYFWEKCSQSLSRAGIFEF